MTLLKRGRWPGLGFARIALAAAMGLGAAVSQAHDTWLQRRADATPQRPVVVLGTGNLYPTVDARDTHESLARSGCRAAGVARSPLIVADPRVEELVLAPSQPLPPAPRVSCWAQQQPLDVDFDDELVDLYFREAQPPAAVRSAWAAQKARGQRWTERFVKHARLEWFPDPQASAEHAAEPVGLDVDALLLSPLKAPRVGQEAEFQLLKNGQPLRGQAVEFRVHHSRLGLWRRTDDNGRVRLTLPAAGRWLLRGIELTPPPEDTQRWQGLFFTLAFDVLPPER